jgi:serine/threonine-protein kinase
MTIDAELARLGEPPLGPDEESLITVLDEILKRRACGEPIRLEELLADRPDLVRGGTAILQAVKGLEALAASVLEHSGIGGDPASLATVATEVYREASPDSAPGMPDPAPGEYRVLKFLGEGRFSRVWLADHLGFQMPVALKTLHFEVSGWERALALAALQNEARILARLQHPNVVRVYDLFQAGGEHYLVLQYVDGGSFEARLKTGGPLGWQLAARYIADVGEALLRVHKDVVHCDIKPANLLWDRQRDEALLTDFGLATRLANTGQVAGTPLYMAPEAFAGRNTPAGDVYGLAASLFALMTGRVPFPAETRAELLEQISRGLPNPEPLLAGVPQRLEQILRSGLAANPERRPELGAFVSDLRGSLNRLLADSLVMPANSTGAAAPVNLRLTVARQESGDNYVPLTGRHREIRGLTRDLKKVPPLPEQVGLRTGDRVRIEVAADRDGFVTVFNVGPTGHLNLLYPDPATAADQSAPVLANEHLQVLDVALTPPAGNERLFAVWSRMPLSLEKVVELTRSDAAVSPSYRATRDMERVQESIQRLRREDWHTVVLELDHSEV